MLGATRDARRRVINRFVETELPAKSQPMQPLQIATRRIRFDHQRHCAGVRRDHQILAQAALESEPRHSKGAVLVIALRIYRVVAGFGYAPGHIARHAIPDLRLHCAAHRAMQQRLRVAWHHQIRHQILEHRAAPRQQRRLAACIGQRAPEGEPALLRQPALRNRHEDSQTRFRSEQIVIPRIQAALVDVVADRQQLLRGAIKKVVVHLRQAACDLRQLLKFLQTCRGPALRAGRTIGCGQLPQRCDTAVVRYRCICLGIGLCRGAMAQLGQHRLTGVH